LKQVETIVPTSSTVLFLGETGTGKELIARGLRRVREPCLLASAFPRMVDLGLDLFAPGA